MTIPLPRRPAAAAPSRFLRAVYYVGPLLLWMGLIFYNSTDHGSAAHTRPVVEGLLRHLWPSADRYLSAETIDRVDWDIRKCAHVFEYGVLGVLSFRAVAYGDKRFRSRNVLAPFLLSVLYAASDEYHQSFVPSRGAAAADVFFDSYGALAGIVLCLWYRLHRETARAWSAQRTSRVPASSPAGEARTRDAAG